MNKLNITKGNMKSRIDADDFGVEYNGFEGVRWRYVGAEHNEPVAIVLKVSNDDCGDEIKANAELIAEAFNVYNETGLTPRELLDLSRELREAMRNYRSAVKIMNAAMKDGLNVQGALSAIVSADEDVDMMLSVSEAIK